MIRNKISKIVVAGLFAMCMIVPMFFHSMSVKGAEDGTDYKTVYYAADKVEKFLSNDESHCPDEEISGYLFAGWYNSEDPEEYSKIGNAVTDSGAVPAEGAYALYVPEQVLGVMAQVSGNLLDENLDDDKTGAIRFATSVDSLNYNKVGFIFDFDKGAQNYKVSNSKVYGSLFGVTNSGIDKNKELEYIPEDTFHPLSHYFKTYAFVDVPEAQYDWQITVTPFWETLDGTVVKAPNSVKCINSGRGIITVKSYEELKGALNYIDIAHIKREAQITLAGDIEIPETVTINSNRNIVIQDDGSKQRTIQRADEFTETPPNYRGVLFDVSSGATLTFQSTGSDENPMLIIDGNKKQYQVDQVKGNWALVTMLSGSSGVNIYKGVQFQNNISAKAGGVIYTEASSGALSIDGAIFQNNETHGSSGGVIYLNSSKEAVKIQNTKFAGNLVESSTTNVNGGAIFICENMTATIEGCTFTQNTATRNGGAVYIEGSADIKDCEFDNNEADAFGGAIMINKDGSVVNLSGKMTFKDNGALQGAAIGANRGTLTITDGTFEFKHNTATTQGGAIYMANSASVDIAKGATFSSNEATEGGAVYMTGTASLTVTDGTFSDNIATTNGGAVYVDAGTLNSTNGTFENNSAPEGGAIYVKAGTLGVTGGTFQKNIANSADNDTGGGAIHLGTKDTTVSATIKKAVFTENESKNTGGHGGAIYSIGKTTSTIDNCTFTKNTANTNGGAIHFIGNSTAEIIETKFEGNNAGRFGGAIMINAASATVTLTGNNKENAVFKDNVAQGIQANGTPTSNTAGAVHLHVGVLNGEGYKFENNTPTGAVAGIYVNTQNSNAKNNYK